MRLRTFAPTQIFVISGPFFDKNLRERKLLPRAPLPNPAQFTQYA